jgi:hypothetical protein
MRPKGWSCRRSIQKPSLVRSGLIHYSAADNYSACASRSRMALTIARAITPKYRIWHFSNVTKKWGVSRRNSETKIEPKPESGWVSENQWRCFSLSSSATTVPVWRIQKSFGLFVVLHDWGKPVGRGFERWAYQTTRPTSPRHSTASLNKKGKMMTGH